MKAFEFINEAKVSEHPKSTKEAIPGMGKYPQMDNSYGIYRFGVAMASSPETTNDPSSGPIGNVPVTIAYSKGDDEIINATIKQTGETRVTVTPSGSREHTDTYTTSPVAKPKRNKYGI